MIKKEDLAVSPQREPKILLLVFIHFVLTLFAVYGSGISQGATLMVPFILDLPITIFYGIIALFLGIYGGFSESTTQYNLVLAYIFFPGLGSIFWWYLARKLMK